MLFQFSKTERNLPFNAKTWNIIWYDAINVESVNSNRDSFAIQDLPQ